MALRTVIIDGDPGVDDAVALLLAFASPELEIAAVTTVAGNVPAVLTARNARVIRALAGREDVPVHAGCLRPILREPVDVDHFHGESGLGDLPVDAPGAPAAPSHAVDAILDIVMSRPPGTVDLAVMGPMTNLALALRLQPALAGRLGTVAVMGGARREGGNITASSEYNIHADPHAAAIVFSSGLKPVVLGLDATHQVRSTAERIARIETLETPSAKAAAALLRFSNRVEREQVGDDAAPLHDPCTVACLLRPDLFESRPCRLEVETASPLTLGHTAVEFRGDPARANARWVTAADADGVFALLTERLSQA